MPSLEEMRIALEGIGHALADNLLAVPMYQRSYAWEDRHIKDLFQDIATAISKNEKEYFLGSIVVTRTTADRPEVVDGQQRLATTTILLAAIRDWFIQKGDVDRAQDIEREFLITRNIRTQEKDARLRLNEIDQDFFVKFILSRPDDPGRSVQPTKESHRRIERGSEVAKEHVERIAELSSTPVDMLIDWIEYMKFKAKVIWVTVPSYANAFTIFETLNDRGLDLAISDLLKNHLFHLSGDRIAAVQQRWISMFAVLEAVAGERVVVDYIRHLWSSRYGATREKDLYDSIKAKVTSKQAAIDFANELSESAKLYAAILSTSHEFWNEYGPTAREHVATMNLLRMAQIRPLLLAVLLRFSIPEVKKILGVMVSWGVRFLITGGLGGGMLERHYSEKAREVQSGAIATAKQLSKAMKSIVPSDGQFETAFSNARVSTNYLARYYLRSLEKQARGEAQPELVPNPNEEIVNLEHILPEHPSTSWAHIDDELASAYRKRMGNMALLRARINAEAGNDGFLDKRPFYAKSDFKLTSDLAAHSTWGTADIDQRQKYLAQLAVGAWPNVVR